MSMESEPVESTRHSLNSNRARHIHYCHLRNSTWPGSTTVDHQRPVRDFVAVPDFVNERKEKDNMRHIPRDRPLWNAIKLRRHGTRGFSWCCSKQLVGGGGPDKLEILESGLGTHFSACLHRLDILTLFPTSAVSLDIFWVQRQCRSLSYF